MAPTTPAPSPAKVCIVCKQDCSTRPRNKDEQGRYTCQDCAKKMATAGASRGGSAPAAPPKPVVKAASSGSAVASAASGKQAAGRGGGGPGGMDDGLSKLAADPLPAYMFEEKPVELTAEQETCQNCGNIMRKSHVLCIKCGHNKQNHKTLHTALKRPEVISEKKSASYDLDSWFVWSPLIAVSVGIIGTMVGTADNTDQQELHGLAIWAAWIYFGVTGMITVAAMFMGGLWHGIFGALALGVPAFNAMFNGTIRVGIYKLVGLAYILYWVCFEAGSMTVRVAYISGMAAMLISLIYIYR